MTVSLQSNPGRVRAFLLALSLVLVHGTHVAEAKGAKEASASKPAPAEAAAPIHRVVIQLTSDNEEIWNATLNQIENLKKGLAPDSVEIELVTHGNAAGFVLSKNTAISTRIQKIEASGANVAFCSNTQKKNNIKPEEITAGVTIIPSGIVQVIKRQEEGWSYVKAGL